MTSVGLIWAQSSSGVIGRDGGIPWRLPEDQARFKELTMGRTVVMGRLTWESLPARVRPLPGRKNVVLTRQADYMAEGAHVVPTLQDALSDDLTWVIGGEQIYTLALPLATRCEVTEVEVELPRDDGDATAPVLDEAWVGTEGEWLTSSSGAALPVLQLRSSVTVLTAAQARRIAVAAQGFAEPNPRGPVTRAHLRRLISRIQVLQMDSVSVAVRAHYAPIFSRLGPYDRDVLDRAAWSHTARSPRLLVEYWAHEAALMAVDDWPLLRWRMREYTHGRWGKEIVKKNAKLADDIVAAVAELGPSTAGQIEAHLESEPRGRKGPWWDRSDTKWVAEALFAAGVLTTATRVGFARHYDLTENVLPPDVVAREVDDDEAIRELTQRAATALGVATEPDIRDYFRLSPKQAKAAIAKLVADGELEAVDVDGWTAPAYLPAGQIIPRRDRGTALLCPFDPLIFFRPRVERLFDFHYRIEIYVPAPKRQFGYYVWPFMLDGRLVGRVDLKAERTRDALHVVGAFTEPGEKPSQVAVALATELRAMASWLGLADVTVGERGDLPKHLSRSLG